MGIQLSIAGNSYTYPTAGDTDWANQASQWASAVTSSLLPKLGGQFLISGNVDFGGIAGLSATYFASNSSASIPATGFLRMANGDKLTWLSTNTVDKYSISVDSSNLLQFYLNNSAFRVACTNLEQAWTKGQAVTPYSVTSSSGTLALDLTQSNCFTTSLHENITTLNPASPIDGQPLTIVFQQTVGSYTVAWPSSFVWVGTAPGTPAVTTINTKFSLLTGFYSATFGSWFCTLASQA